METTIEISLDNIFQPVTLFSVEIDSSKDYIYTINVHENAYKSETELLEVKESILEVVNLILPVYEAKNGGRENKSVIKLQLNPNNLLDGEEEVELNLSIDIDNNCYFDEKGLNEIINFVHCFTAKLTNNYLEHLEKTFL